MLRKLLVFWKKFVVSFINKFQYFVSMKHYVLGYQESRQEQPSNFLLMDQRGKRIIYASTLDGLFTQIKDREISDVTTDIPSIDLDRIRGRYAAGHFICPVTLD